MSWRNNETKIKLFNAIKTYDEFIIFDLETTGLSPKNSYVIEIAALKLVLKNKQFVMVDKLHKFINPMMLVSPKIEELTGLTNDFLSKQSLEKDIINDIVLFFEDLPIIAQNQSFDCRFMTSMFERYNCIFSPAERIDTLEMARDLIDKSEVESYKLCDLASYYGIDNDVVFHNALDDVTVTLKLFNLLYQNYLETPVSNNVENKKIAKIISVKYWEGPRGLCRAYVTTDFGTVFYDIRYKRWDAKDVSIELLNMEQLEKDALSFHNLSCLEEFKKLKNA